MIGRLTQQKGLDLVQRILDELMQQAVQFAVLGTGDYEYEEMFKGFSYKYPGKVSANIRFSEPLSHRLYSGGDMLLMPSLFEPCGLSQMIAMHFGTLPIVRETGGLRDTVKPYNMYTGEGTGFSFANYNAHEMLFTIKAAIDLYYNNKDAWKKMQETAMKTDFSWNVAADKYKKLYEQLHPEVEPYVIEKKDENITKEEKNEEKEDKKQETVNSKEDKEVVKEPEEKIQEKVVKGNTKEKTDNEGKAAEKAEKNDKVKVEEKKETKAEKEVKKSSSSVSKKQTSSASKTTSKSENKTASKTTGKSRKTTAKKTNVSNKTIKKESSNTSSKGKKAIKETAKKESNNSAIKVKTAVKDNNKK